MQYRFAAAEVAAPEFKAKAISLVLAGGIAGGFLGPEASRWAKDLLPVPFLGSFIVLSAIALVALSVQSQVRVPVPSVAGWDGGRPLSQIARRPVFVVAVLSAALGYGVMNLLITATPLQNSLLELYGLVSFLDEHLFGDIEAFRARYMRGSVEQRQLAELRQRLRPGRPQRRGSRGASGR